jgi:mono/diheme cytochrome c family protein
MDESCESGHGGGYGSGFMRVLRSARRARRLRFFGAAGPLTLVRLAVLGFVAAAVQSSASAQPFRLTDYSGQELFQQFCSACHGEAAKGDGPVAGSLNVNVPDLTRLRERHDGAFPADLVRATIDGRNLAAAHGTRTMPVWGYEFWVTEGADRQAEADARKVINRLIQYLESIQVEADSRSVPR